ncbi:hypothetical protein EV401DRAFT_2016147 [Pisolithus croceorrhizus]|nr:hypothetical protein EV401DRAFT_2016147 [Pisolithus croceorrhizus]
MSGLCVFHLGGYRNGYSPSVDILRAIRCGCPNLQEFALGKTADVDFDKPKRLKDVKEQDRKRCV